MDESKNTPLENLFDVDGFFRDAQPWDEALAQRIAQHDGMGELSRVQMELLHTLRTEYQKNGNLSALSHICHIDGQSADCLHDLFPSPRHAWRLAGLPHPGDEAKVYME